MNQNILKNIHLNILFVMICISNVVGNENTEISSSRTIGIGPIPGSLSGYLNYELKNGTYTRIQLTNYQEFQGFFPSVVEEPFEKYVTLGLEIGKQFKTKHLGFGIYSGFGYTKGRIRGNYLSTETCTGCLFNSETKYYNEVKLNNVSIPTTLEFLVFWKYIGISLTPIITYCDGNVFSFALLNIGFGKF
jgi:hypothetical protein